jgi:hypothetical protein
MTIGDHNSLTVHRAVVITLIEHAMQVCGALSCLCGSEQARSWRWCAQCSTRSNLSSCLANALHWFGADSSG